MAAKLKLISGSTIRWGARRFDVVDYVGLDAVIAREVVKRNSSVSQCRFMVISPAWLTFSRDGD